MRFGRGRRGSGPDPERGSHREVAPLELGLATPELGGGAREDDGQLLSPFALLAIDCTPAQQRQIGALRSRSLARGVHALPARALVREPVRRLRVGYLSSDIYQHATAVLMAELLERRDAERFEVVMYSHSRDDRSLLRSRVIAACVNFLVNRPPGYC